jgi:tetratricopeptide (TPR) repeat protein
MPTYLWSGKTSSGEEQAERVAAATAQEAREILEKRGWKDLRLHTDEIGDFVKRQVEAVSAPEYRADTTPKQDLAYHQGKAGGLWNNWLNSVRESAGTLLAVAGCFALAAYAHRFWGMVIFGATFVGLLFLLPALHLWFGRTRELFQKLHEARNWWRWDEVLLYLEKLRKAQRSRKMGIGEAEMARYRALALAGLGKLDEALNCFNEAAGAAKMPQWLRSSFLSTIHVVAGQYDKALQCHRQAVAEATDKATPSIDLAAFLVQRFNYPAEAKELLAAAEKSPLTETARPHVSAVRGVIALRQNDFATANRLLLEALAGFEKNAGRRRYIFEPSILLTQGYLAVANAALGNKQAAREYFAKSEKYLAVIRLDEVIAMYKSHG